ncbi:MAG TPA: hypothetical protein VM287_02485 [Egibacteraceae bacterium]|jgi:hypothetical protein|nr:hypothetical protein [Egibacteraceae bacterium]
MAITVFTAALTAVEASRRFQDPDALICPVCGEQAFPEPPAYWLMHDGPRPDFSHADRLALCATPRTGRPVEPIAVDR